MGRITFSVNQTPRRSGQVDEKLEPSIAATVRVPGLPWRHLSLEPFGWLKDPLLKGQPGPYQLQSGPCSLPHWQVCSEDYVRRCPISAAHLGAPSNGRHP